MNLYDNLTWVAGSVRREAVQKLVNGFDDVLEELDALSDQVIAIAEIRDDYKVAEEIYKLADKLKQTSWRPKVGGIAHNNDQDGAIPSARTNQGPVLEQQTGLAQNQVP